MRLLWLALAFALLLLIPFALWGSDFAQWFDGERAVSWIRAREPWGAVSIIALLMSDLFLPLPATGLMSAAGFLYGPFIGGLISALGSFLAGLLAYGLCWKLGRATALRLAGGEDVRRGEILFARWGAWLVAFSRALPILPEVIACLAGVTRLPPRTFLLALACGSVPIGFIYAAIGALGKDDPRLAFALSVGLPPLLWLLAGRLLRRRP